MARPRQISDKQILETARECFLAHGPAVSTTVIAERLGISQATLFQRFGTKEELLMAALEPPGEVAWVDKLVEGPDARNIRDQLIEIAGSANAYFLKLVPCIAILRASGISPEQMMAHRGELPQMKAVRALSGWLTRAQAEGRIRPSDPDSIAIALLGAMQARPFMEHISGRKLAKASARECADSVIEALWNGLAPGEKP